MKNMESEFFIRPYGTLDYHYDEEENVWHIDWIESREKGGGCRLITELVNKLGRDEKISASLVIEPETRDKLIKLGLHDKLLKSSENSMIITDHDILDKIKLVKTFQRGGVVVESLQMNKVNLKIVDQGELKDISTVQISILGRT
jgi:hypothetical protein